MKYNLAELIEEEAEEQILFAVIGDMGWGDGYKSEHVPNYDQQPKYKLLKWDDASKWLDYDTDFGYGAPSHNSVYCWTENFVLFFSQYDGSTNVERIPRNPISCEPYMPGG